MAERNRRDWGKEKVDIVTGWWGLGNSSRKGTSFISEIDPSWGAGGSNLSSALDPGKRGSFGVTRDEFKYVKKSAELLISDDGVDGAERDE